MNYQPLNINHPANAQAMAAPRTSLSKTLAYSREDMPAVAVRGSTEAGHEGHHPAGEASGQKTVVGEGRLSRRFRAPISRRRTRRDQRLHGGDDHGISGRAASLLEGLKPGDQVRFTIDVPKKTIIKIEKLK